MHIGTPHFATDRSEAHAEDLVIITGEEDKHF